jgi:hypothetical protein
MRPRLDSKVLGTVVCIATLFTLVPSRMRRADLIDQLLNDANQQTEETKIEGAPVNELHLRNSPPVANTQGGPSHLKLMTSPS